MPRFKSIHSQAEDIMPMVYFLACWFLSTRNLSKAYFNNIEKGYAVCAMGQW